VIRAMTLAALLAGTAAAGVKYVAVVETDIDASSGASEALNSAEVRQITAELRRVAVENLPRDKYNIMTSETVQSMGGAVLEECADENCVITLGSKIGADYIVRGIISKFGTKLTLAVEMYETENGTLVASSEPVRSENKAELLEMAAGACERMYGKFMGVKMQTAGQEEKTRKEAKTKSTESYKANTRNNNQSENQYQDFTLGQRIGTCALNVTGGLGSFLIMKDYVGGSIILGTEVIIVAVFMINENPSFKRDHRDLQRVFGMVGLGALIGGQIFNSNRSFTYHKPKSSAAANFKPYDGLKLAVFPTESGDCKVFARYDYSF